MNQRSRVCDGTIIQVSLSSNKRLSVSNVPTYWVSRRGWTSRLLWLYHWNVYVVIYFHANK